MNFKFVWLMVLTMLMGSASAASINFNGGSVGSCTLSGSAYRCDNTFAPGSNDILVIASGYTVILSTAFTPGWDQGLTMSGSAALQTTDSNAINLTGSNNINVSGGTITAGGNFRLGSNAQTITADVVAASITTGGAAATINGKVTTTGNADLGSHTTISGAVKVGSVTTNSDVSMGPLTATGSINLGSRTTVNGAVSGASISTTSQVTLGPLSVTGTADLGSQTVVNGAISANVLTTNSNVSLKGDVNATTSFTLGSGSDMTGNVTAPAVTLNPSNVTVTGNIAASTALDIGSGNTVTGNVSGGSLLMRPANATINGSVTLTGDVDMGSQSNINGDVVAHDVVTRSSSANINGNAAVNSIYIDWHDTVGGVITCTGPGAVGCSCVTTADPNYHPTCGAAPPGVPHHFQITHSGSALTCQPQTVTVTACANANCTAPNFTSNVDVTLQPGGQTFTISGGSNSAATVQASKAGIYLLSATASGVTNATSCVNTGTIINNDACNMQFKTSGLTVSAPSHVSMAPGVLVTVQALTAQPGLPSCVPLVANKTVNVDMACSYQNPASGSVNVGIGAQSAACGANAFGTPATVPLTFDGNGKATAALQYADVGMVGLSATYTAPGLSATGSGSFYAAPAGFRVTATNAVPAPNTTTFDSNTQTSMPSGVFAKASEPFTLTITAVNQNGAPTPNFGKESTPSKVKVTPTVNKSDDTPIAAPVPAGTGNNGALTYAFPAFAGGAASSSANFDDVGYTKLTVALDDGTATALPYYLGQPVATFQTSGTLYVARFVPDHFDTVLVPNTSSTPANLATMTCPSSTSSIYPCSGNSSFTHSKQNFAMQVLAYNGAATPALTTNYAGALSSAITLQAMTAKGGAAVDGNGAFSWSKESSAPLPARFTFTGGTGSLDLSVDANGVNTGNLPSYVFSAPHVPVTIYLRATDADGASSLRTAPTNSVEAPLTIVSGRLLVTNSYGSPSAPLPVPVSAQYLMPVGYVFNPLAQATGSGKISSYITFSNCQKALASGYCATLKLSDPNALLSIANGVGKFTLAAPVPTVSGVGSVDVTLKNGSTDLIPFLPSTTGKETFGVYRSGPVIYMREVY